MRPDSHRGPGTCFHCKCEKCGKLIHLHCEELQEIQSHLLGEHGFQLDPRRTVLYGLCEGCRAEGVKTPYCESLCPIRLCAAARAVETCGACAEAGRCEKLAMIVNNNAEARRNLGLPDPRGTGGIV